MYEVFMDIKGYKGHYQVSNLGRIRSLKSNKILKGRLNNSGYVLVDLFKNGKRDTRLVHRIVLDTFKANPDNKSDVNHINEDKTDNRLNNLEWMTRKENINHGNGKRRSFETRKKNGSMDRLFKKLKGNQNGAKRVLCIETGLEFDSIKEAGTYYKICKNSIGLCCRGERKTAGSFHWKFIDKGRDNNE